MKSYPSANQHGRQFGIGAEHWMTDVIEVLIWNPRFLKVERRLHDYSKVLKSSEFLSLRVTEFWRDKVSNFDPRSQGSFSKKCSAIDPVITKKIY